MVIIVSCENWTGTSLVLVWYFHQHLSSSTGSMAGQTHGSLHASRGFQGRGSWSSWLTAHMYMAGSRVVTLHASHPILSHLLQSTEWPHRTFAKSSSVTALNRYKLTCTPTVEAYAFGGLVRFYRHALHSKNSHRWCPFPGSKRHNTLGDM